MNVLDLFSGIGGFSLGLERAGMKTVAFCEINPFAQQVLRKHWPDVPIYEDVRTITREQLAADGIDRIDVVTGGYPCQPFSLAGKRRGEEDDRHLWPAMLDIIKAFRPTWVLGENVAGHISMGLDEVCADLEAAGYAVQPFIIPAASIGARHLRYRVWIVAHSECNSVQGGSVVTAERQNGGGRTQEQLAGLLFPCAWPSLSFARNHRDDDGIPDRIHRNKALGNTVMPQIPEMLGRAILASARV
jgi:DNA (cytosine-5)-methyltransferase 1